MKDAAKPYIFIAKLLIILFAFGFIYNQIRHQNSYFFSNLFKTLEQPNNRTYLAICLLLVFVNWGLESYKWQKMILKVEPISFLNAFKAVLSGVTVSIFTPNRVGEFGGRIVYLDRADWIKASLISILCGIGQLLVTLVVGICGFLLFFPTYFEIDTYLYLLIAFISSALLVFMLVSYFNISALEAVLEKFNSFLAEKTHTKWIKGINHYIVVFSYYNFFELLQLLLVSLVRYLVFSIQFWLMLTVFGIQMPMTTGLVLISVVFLCMTVIPTFAVTEIGVRTSVAVYILGSYYLHKNYPLVEIENLNLVNPEFSPSVIASSFSLWLVNLAFPALIGAAFLLRLRFKNLKV